MQSQFELLKAILRKKAISGVATKKLITRNSCIALNDLLIRKV